MGRGEIEQFCFESVKTALFSEEEICYGSSVDNKKQLKTIFKSAIPTPQLSSFHDFIFDGGFIEHFEITSSHSNRNGSTMKREQDKLAKEAKAKEEAFMDEMSNTPDCDGKTIITDTWHSNHSYDNFCLSFKKSWEKHIDSLDKYTGEKSTGIFMMQYNDLALVLDAKFPDVKTELFYGDLLERPKYRGYRLTHDSCMLEYIYQFKEKIGFVIFFNNDSVHGNKCEIICVKNIPEILKIIKGKYAFHCVTVGTACLIGGINFPTTFFERSEEHDET